MSLPQAKTRAAFERAKTVMPYGVSSNFRYWGEEDTPVVSRAEGAYIWDMDGNKFIDYRLAFGPVILGHADSRVNKRVMESMANGVLFAHTHMLEVEVAERIIRMCPGVEMVRYANSGTEATMHALRVARAYTNREKVIKFEGNYHGFQDYTMFSTAMSSTQGFGSRRSPMPAPSSSGIPSHLRELIITLPYNDLEMLERMVKARWGEVAAIIVEPSAGNIAALMPHPEFLPGIRRLCDEYGIVMIMDEVKTGFRMAKGGATEYFGVRGDLMTYAKALANGYPLAALGGKKDVMMTIEPGRMAQGGTYCGNGVGTAAAAAVLEVLETTDELEQMHKRGERLQRGMSDIFTEAGWEHEMLGHPSMFGFALLPKNKPVRDYRELTAADTHLYEKLAFAWRARGVEIETDFREPLFLCTALTDADVDFSLNTLNDAVKEVKK